MGSRKSIVLGYSKLLLPLLLFLLACNSDRTKHKASEGKVLASTEHFQIIEQDDYFILTLNEFFQGSENREKYILYPRDSKKPQGVSEVTHYIEIPLETVAINSTTHLGYLLALEKQEKITAAHNLSYAYNQEFNQKLENGEVITLGKPTIDRELFIEASPDVFFGFAIDAASYQELHSLRKLNQKVVFISEFMEDDPLNKASWLQVFAIFFGKEMLEKAQLHLREIEHDYTRLKTMALKAESRPIVMIGLPWKGTWYVSGGKSFQAQFLKDANANYLWKDFDQKASVPLAIERVFEKALNTDYWINPGSAKSLKDIENRDERFTHFKPYQNQKVFNQNKRMSTNEGNDYWESGVIQPEIILGDLIQIFHPELLPNRELYYYQQLEP